MELEQKDIESFNAIKEFVECLNGVFGMRNQKLALFNRLVETTTLDQISRVQLIISTFKEFCQTYSSLIINKTLDMLPSGTRICYDGKVNISIEIKHLLSNSTPEIKRTINDHLLSITALLGDVQTLQNIDELLKKELERPQLSFDDSTPEGRFMTEILNKTQNTFNGVLPPDPMSAIMTMASSGAIKEITENITSKISSGEVDVSKLVGLMQGMIGGIKDVNVQEIARMIEVDVKPKIEQ
jgi:hypothetical protein